MPITPPLPEKARRVLWLAVCGVRGVYDQADRMNTDVTSIIQYRDVIYSRLRVPNLDQAVAITVRDGDVYIRELNEPTTIKQDICQFVGDVWKFSRSKLPQDCASYMDVLTRFRDVSTNEVMETLKQLDEEGWIERVEVGGVERYKPLATP